MRIDILPTGFKGAAAFRPWKAERGVDERGASSTCALTSVSAAARQDAQNDQAVRGVVKLDDCAPVSDAEPVLARSTPERLHVAVPGEGKSVDRCLNLVGDIAPEPP